MEVRPGYRQTAIGVIPEDWEVVPIGDIARFKSGSPIDFSSLGAYSPDCPVPVYGGNGIAGYTTDAILLAQSVVVGRVGQKCGMVYLTDGPAWVTDNALHPEHICRPMDVRFLALTLQRARLNEVRNRNDLPLITQTIVHAVRIAWPPNVSEQRAIAAALSDVDALITSLDTLIAKKRDIKKATMQQLLTGKTRLPGFSGEWESKCIGQLLEYEQPTKYLVQDTEYADIGVPVLTAGKTFILGHTTEQEGIYTSLPVIVFDDFTTASKYVSFPFKVKSSAIKLLRARNSNVDLRFVYGKMQILPFALGDHKRYYISEYQHIETEVPSTTEQRTIATVLSDMDAEITALERRRDKTRALKQSMMQELLTGRTRLL